MKGDEEGLTVPKAAIIRDYFGGTWVYEMTAPHTYVRRRVTVDRVVGPVAMLAAGPKQGAKVVTLEVLPRWPGRILGFPSKRYTLAVSDQLSAFSQTRPELPQTELAFRLIAESFFGGDGFRVFKVTRYALAVSYQLISCQPEGRSCRGVRWLSG